MTRKRRKRLTAKTLRNRHKRRKKRKWTMAGLESASEQDGASESASVNGSVNDWNEKEEASDDGKRRRRMAVKSRGREETENANEIEGASCV